MLDFPGKPPSNNHFDVNKYRMEFIKHYQRAKRWANEGLETLYPNVWMFGIPPREIIKLSNDTKSYLSPDPKLPEDPYNLSRLIIGGDIIDPLIKPMKDYRGVRHQEYWHPFYIGRDDKRIMIYTVQDIWLLFPQDGKDGTIPRVLLDHGVMCRGDKDEEDDIPFKDADQLVLKAMLFQGMEDKYNQRNLISPNDNQVKGELNDVFSKKYWLYRKYSQPMNIIMENLTPCQRMIGLWIRYFRRSILRMGQIEFAKRLGMLNGNTVANWETDYWLMPSHRQLIMLWCWWINVVVRREMDWRPLDGFSREDLQKAKLGSAAEKKIQIGD